MTTYDDDMPIYISIYDKPKLKRGPKFSCALTPEEIRQRACDIAKKHYYNNREEINAKHKLYRESIKSKKKMKKYKLFLNIHLFIIILK